MMNRTTRGVAAAAMVALLAGCVSASEAPPVTGQPRPQPGSTSVDPGDPLMGRTASGLVALFGRPTLDVREGPARKLQFSGTSCVLDLYLYTVRQGQEPVSTHVDARLPDGRDADHRACAESLRNR